MNRCPRQVRCVLYLLIAVAFVSSISGCAVLRRCFRREPICVLPPDVSKPQLIDHLNGNTQKVYAWRSTDVKIKARMKGGLPATLSAKLAVESPRNFRLIANSVVSDEVDLGSNPDRFWFWIKRAEPQHVYVASHEAAEQAGQQLRLPFQPDWLIEALGVIPLDESRVTLQPAPQAGRRVHLVAQDVALDGRPVRKVIVVDTCQGVVVERSVYDSAGQLIARATFGNHQADSQSGVLLPHRIELEWPQQGMSLTMRLGPIDVNPHHMPPQTWQFPEHPGYPVYDLTSRH